MSTEAMVQAVHTALGAGGFAAAQIQGRESLNPKTQAAGYEISTRYGMGDCSVTYLPVTSEELQSRKGIIDEYATHLKAALRGKYKVVSHNQVGGCDRFHYDHVHVSAG